MAKVLHKSKYFELGTVNRKTPGRRGKGHLHYTIKWMSRDWTQGMTDDEVMNIVDPNREQSGMYRNIWVFKDRAHAERKYMMLTMRWA